MVVQLQVEARRGGFVRTYNEDSRWITYKPGLLIIYTCIYAYNRHIYDAHVRRSIFRMYARDVRYARCVGCFGFVEYQTNPREKLGVFISFLVIYIYTLARHTTFFDYIAPLPRSRLSRLKCRLSSAVYWPCSSVFNRVISSCIG